MAFRVTVATPEEAAAQGEMAEAEEEDEWNSARGESGSARAR
jgi:hypothetical protein